LEARYGGREGDPAPGAAGGGDLRQNWLSNRVFEDYDAILDAGCDAWNRLISQPQTIMSIGMRGWAHVGQ